MKEKSILHICFSGTGNTRLAVDESISIFQGKGWVADLQCLESPWDVGDLGDYSLLAFAFPVAVHTTYPFVWDFLEALPAAEEGQRAFFMTTLGGNHSCVGDDLTRLLSLKGYGVLGWQEFSMPNNFFDNEKSGEEEEEKRRKALTEVKIFSLAMIEAHRRGDVFREVPPKKLIARIARHKGTWKMMRFFYPLQINGGICRECGLCMRLCPVGNLTGPGIPRSSGECQLCMRCVNVCPVGALGVKGIKRRYAAVNLVKMAGAAAQSPPKKSLDPAEADRTQADE